MAEAERMLGRRAIVTGASRGIGAEIATVWLCSDHASFITGATLAIDGGKLAGSPPFSAASSGCAGRSTQWVLANPAHVGSGWTLAVKTQTRR
jgi:hypothetical protein